MGHDKLRKFAENESFACLLQPSAADLLSDGYASLHDHPIKGHWKDHFGNNLPIILELGCGKGEYTIDLAHRDPSKNYIGVDIKGARLWKGAKYVNGNAIKNVAFLRTRIEFIHAFFAPGEVSEIWLTFSDPQYKSPNSRLSSPYFLDRYHKFLAPNGIVHLKTDSRFLYEYTLSVCKENSLEIIYSTEDLYSDSSDYISQKPELTEVQTFYENLFREQGYKITYCAFRIDKQGDYKAPSAFDSDYWRSVEGERQLFGRPTAETRRRKLQNSQK